MKPYSWNSFLAAMNVGGRKYVEVTLDNYAQVMRTANAPKSRRPAELYGKEFTSSFLTAVGTKAGDVRYLVCIERTQ